MTTPRAPQASVELDRLVATQVMGWKLTDDRKRGSPIRNRAGCLQGMCLYPVPNYSGDMKAAWPVYEHLAKLCGSWLGADGYGYLIHAESACHRMGGKSGRKDTRCDPPYPMPDQADDDDHDYGSWSCHFHCGLIGMDAKTPERWDHGSRFCARADTAALAICRAAILATAPALKSTAGGR